MPATYALEQIGPAAVPGLVQAILEEDRNLRLGAIYAIGRHGTPARAGIPALVSALRDEDGEVFNAAARSLQVILWERDESERFQGALKP